MKVRQQALVDVLKSDPAIEYINSTVGAGGPNPTANYGRLFIALKPQKDARQRAAIVIGRLRQQGAADSGHAGVLPERSRTSTSAAGSRRASTNT